MLLFIDQTTVHLLDRQKRKPIATHDLLKIEDLKGKIQSYSGKIDVVGVRPEDHLTIISYFRNKLFKDVTVLRLYIDDPDRFIKDFKKEFNIVKAAGGLVHKKDRLLFIHRLGLWDLPKGKLEKKEKMTTAAVREVEEECNIKVSLGEKICTTWHTYFRNDKFNLKKTNWYHMKLVSDDKMAPQIKEGIDRVEWIGPGDLETVLGDTYNSIRHVIKEAQSL